MSSRRPHQKSHHGCTSCKRRKVKCDERRPECGSCTKRQLTCSFQGDYVHIPSPNLLVHQHSSSNGQPSTNDHPLPVLELELLHQWYTSTAQELSNGPELRKVMTETIPREGFTQTFLMHGLLAIAALHRVQLDDKERTMTFREAAIQHKQKALSIYTPLLSNITESNCNALFAFSCLLTILSFAFQASDVTRTVKDIADVVDILKLVRGVAVIVDQEREWIESSEMNVLLRSGHFAHYPPDLSSRRSSSEAEVRLQLLLKHCQENCKDSDYMTVYLSSIEALISGYVAHSTAFDNTIVLAWPVLVDSQFFNLLLQKDQLSLVIFAHYGAIMTLLDDIWWLRGWGQLVVSLTSDLLHPSGHFYMVWPLWMVQSKKASSGITEHRKTA